jgi:mono/diheme cytochrome c family protein
MLYTETMSVRMTSALGAGLVLAAAGLAFAAEPWVIPEPEAKKWQNPVPAAELGKSVERGAASFEKNCVSCHGDKGRGDGEVAKTLPQKTPDLTSTAVHSQSDGVLFAKVSQGRRPMIGYARLLSESERWDLVNFLRTLRAKP